MKVYFEKEALANMSKEELQEKLNGLIEYGLVPPTTTLDSVRVYEPTEHSMRPVIYTTKKTQESLLEYIKDGNLIGLAMVLKSIIHGVDDETMKKIQKIVEDKNAKELVQKMHTQTWKSSKYGWIEVTGTDEQFLAYIEKLSENKNHDVIALALDCGLSIKKHN